jgi:hypothetical protein
LVRRQIDRARQMRVLVSYLGQCLDKKEIVFAINLLL